MGRIPCLSRTGLAMLTQARSASEGPSLAGASGLCPSRRQEGVMSEQAPSNPPIPPEVQASLLAISRLLREAHHLGPEAQQTLAELMGELSHALGSSQASPAELAHLTDSTTKLIEAVYQQH